MIRTQQTKNLASELRMSEPNLLSSSTLIPKL